VVPTDPIEVFYQVDVKKSPFVSQMLAKRLGDVMSAVKKPVYRWEEMPYGALPEASSATMVPAKQRSEPIQMAVLLARLTAGGKSLSPADRKAVQLFLNVSWSQKLRAKLANGLCGVCDSVVVFGAWWVQEGGDHMYMIQLCRAGPHLFLCVLPGDIHPLVSLGKLVVVF
jgi:hypothetical protein